MASRNPADFPFRRQIPEGDNRRRLVCGTCGWVHYENPKIVVGAVCSWERLLLLCRRSIEPRRGFWTMPAGFLEEHESPEAGAAREAREEACVEIRIDALLGVYSVPRISQVQLIYRAALVSPEFAAGDETEEVRLFRFDEIPWQELAFPSVEWALRNHAVVVDRAEFAPFQNAGAVPAAAEPNGRRTIERDGSAAHDGPPD